MSGFTTPLPLAAEHITATFESGEGSLDRWLQQKALKNEQSGASRTYVSCTTEAVDVAGFYSLAAASVTLATAPGSVRRNMPEPMPVILLGRLAVASAHQGRGLGAALLDDAVRRSLNASASIGARALLVHALNTAGAEFYVRYGFEPSPIDEQTLFLPFTRIARSVAIADGE